MSLKPHVSRNLSELLKRRLSERHLLQIHAQIICQGVHQDKYIVTRLIGHYPLPIALHVFDQLQVPHIYPFNAIIRVSAEGKTQSSLAFSFFKRLRQQSLDPNEFTYSFLLKACLTYSNPLKQVHAQITKSGFLGNSAVCNGLLVSYAKGLKDFVLAQKVFNEMPDKSSVYSWTCLIDVYAKSGLPEKALLLFLQMAKGKVMPDNGTMVSVLSACARLDMGGLDNWVRVFLNGVEDGCYAACISDSVNTVLSYLYGRLGKIEESREAFDKISDAGKRNVVAWNSIIGAYVQNGCAVEALNLFKVMIDYPHISPNHVTMLLSIVLPIVGFGLFLWWAKRDVVQSACPNCGNEFQVFKSSLNDELQLCPFCSQPFSVEGNKYVKEPINFSNRSTPFGQAFDNFSPLSGEGKEDSTAIVDVEAEVKDAE